MAAARLGWTRVADRLGESREFDARPGMHERESNWRALGPRSGARAPHSPTPGRKLAAGPHRCGAGITLGAESRPGAGRFAKHGARAASLRAGNAVADAAL